MDGLIKWLLIAVLIGVLVVLRWLDCLPSRYDNSVDCNHRPCLLYHF